MEKSKKDTIETITVTGGQLLEHVQQLLHQGNIRRIVISQEGRVLAEFPLTIGVVGAVLAPVLAAIGALAALLTKCTIEIERIDSAEVKQVEETSRTESVASEESHPLSSNLAKGPQSSEARVVTQGETR